MCAHDSPVHLNFNHTAVKCAALTGICEPVSHILTQLFNIALTLFVANLDCPISSGRSI